MISSLPKCVSLLPDEEKAIVANLDSIIKSYTEETRNITQQINDSRKQISDRENELKSPAEKAKKKSRNIKKALYEAKIQICDRNAVVDKKLQSLDETFWNSFHTSDFVDEYQKRLQYIYTQRLLRNDEERKIEHAIRQIDEILDTHQRINAAYKSEKRAWTRSVAAAAGTSATVIASFLLTLPPSVPVTVSLVGLVLIASQYPQRPQGERPQRPQMPTHNP